MADPNTREQSHDMGLSAFSPAQPLLLVTDFAPDMQGGGAVILRSLLTSEDRARMVWVTLSSLLGPAEPRVVSLAHGPRRSVLKDGTVRVRALRQGARAVMRDYGSTAAWVVAHGACVRVTPGLLAHGVPVHVTVHDDPAWAYARLTRRYRALVPLLARDLGRSLRGARSVDVVSEPMARRYRGRYGVESSVVHRGLPARVAPSPEYCRGDGLSVALLGSTYGLREVSALLQALAVVRQRLRVPTRLTVIGGVDEARVRLLCPSSVGLEITGHVSESEGVAKLQTSFLSYLSYPFGERGRVLRTTSFPTKLSTYVMAARPLLLHMPSESSVAFLGSRSPYATLWDSPIPDQGADLMIRLWGNDRTDQSFDAEAEQVRSEYFDLSRNRTILLRALNSLAGG